MQSQIRQTQLDELIDKFANLTQMQFGKGAQASVLDEIERKCDVRLPPDFRYFYEKLDGYLVDMEMDGCYFSLWSTKRILSEEETPTITTVENQRSVDVPFGDFLIQSHFYFLRFDSDNRFIGVFTLDDKIACDFKEFLEKFLSDRSSLYLVSC